MRKYWTLDYVNGELGECELVYNDQLYSTEEEAAAAREKTGNPNLFDVTWYTIHDLEDIYHKNITISDELVVCY